MWRKGKRGEVLLQDGARQEGDTVAAFSSVGPNAPLKTKELGAVVPLIL